MILSDSSIKTQSFFYGLIRPFNEDQLQPASYDLQLGIVRDNFRSYILAPKEFVLASTLESVCIPSDLVGRLEGKSSWARVGLIVHTAGFIDPGFEGQLVLEITNLSDFPIGIQTGNLIAQICFEQLDFPATRPYGHPALNSHYQGQTGVTKSYLDV